MKYILLLLTLFSPGAHACTAIRISYNKQECMDEEQCLRVTQNALDLMADELACQQRILQDEVDEEEDIKESNLKIKHCRCNFYICKFFTCGNNGSRRLRRHRKEEYASREWENLDRHLLMDFGIDFNNELPEVTQVIVQIA